MTSYKKFIFLIFAFIFLLTGILMSEPAILGKVGSFICYSCIGF